MKQQQQRESTPLWVWLAFALMAIGAVAYLTGYWMLEDLIAHFRKLASPTLSHSRPDAAC